MTTLTKLNDILFDQLNRLNKDDCDIRQETERAKAMASLAKEAVGNARLAFEASKHYHGEAGLIERKQKPAMLGND
jgi:hypothetical protein